MDMKTEITTTSNVRQKFIFVSTTINTISLILTVIITTVFVVMSIQFMTSSILRPSSATPEQGAFSFTRNKRPVVLISLPVCDHHLLCPRHYHSILIITSSEVEAQFPRTSILAQARIVRPISTGASK